MASDDSEENARRITERTIEAAERCTLQSKAGHKPIYAIAYWNEHCKTAVYARNRARSRVKSSLFVQQRHQAAVIINAMLNRNDKAVKALIGTLM